jgi:hypothetical protein
MNLLSENLPFQAVLALTEQILGGSRRRLPWEQIRQILDDLTEGHRWLGYPMPREWRVFRGRIYNGMRLFKNVSQLSQKKPEDVKDYGRCHRPSRAVFYCANNLDTVLSELSPVVGDQVHVACAKPKNPDSLVVTAIGEIEHVRRYGRALIGDDESTKLIRKFLDDIKSEADLKTLFLDAFMSELFITPAERQEDYKATSALSDIIFAANKGGNPIIDGFAYPSVAHRGGINFSIDGDRFTEKMEIYECMAFQIVESLGFGIYGKNLYAKSQSIGEDGSIEWDLVGGSS